MKHRPDAMLFFVLPALLCGQVKRTPTLDDTLSLKTISAPKISPDGRFVVYQLRETNWKDDEYVSQLWLMNVASGASFQLTRGKKSASQAEWSPDGHWLAFVTERESTAIEPPAVKKEKDQEEKKKEEGKEAGDGGEKPGQHQIWMISPEGGEAWQLTRFGTDVERFHWSKDGELIAFTANPPETKAGKDRKEKYAEYEVYEKDYEQHQLWLIDARAAAQSCLPAEAKKLTSDASLNIGSFNWSPDSTKIAFSASKNPLLAFNGDQDIYLLDLKQNNAVSKIVALHAGTGRVAGIFTGRQTAGVQHGAGAAELLLREWPHCRGGPGNRGRQAGYNSHRPDRFDRRLR
jgi:Tol biopolymer transport system component